MNGLYLAKKQLRIAGALNMVCVSCWSVLLFILAIYHFVFLLNNGQYSTLNNDTSQGSSSSVHTFISTYIASKGYGKLFEVDLVDFLVFKLTLWSLVFMLFLTILISFIGNLLLGFLSLVKFFKAKSIQHIYAALAVIFFPGLGGVIAINTYKATTSRLAPKFVASYSSIRFKFRSLWNNFSNTNTFIPETENKKGLVDKLKNV